MRWIFFVFAMPSLIMAAPIGNPAEPTVLEEGFWISDQSSSSLRFGMAGDFLTQKRLRASRDCSGSGIQESELSWKAAICEVAWNFRERYEIRAFSGSATSSELCWRQEGQLFEAKGRDGTFWGLSGKMVLIEIRDTTFGVDVRGGGIEGIEGPLLRDGRTLAGGFSGSVRFWQIAPGISQNVGLLQPYAGVAVNHFGYHLESETDHLRFRDFLSVGTYVGCSISFGSKAYLNVETRQFFESGVTVSGELRF